jgi:glycosyltransferase involved in cell wall biosynthesis
MKKTKIETNRIGLVMIVKNESKIITRCLESLVDIIDEYLIVDTGSTDNTIEIIDNYFEENHPHIKGRICSREWKNFGHNRTEALKLAKENIKVDWLLTVDADMLVVNEGFDKNKLDTNLGAYLLHQKNGTLKYANVRLLNNRHNWKSIGVTHEFLSSNENSRDTLNTLWINDIGDGGAKSDKFERDIKLLEQGLKDEPNNERYMFYLANSYKDTHQWEKAINLYQSRINVGGWIEEITCSYEYMGFCYEYSNNIDKAISTWMLGYEKNPNRAECLYNAIRLLRIQGKNKIAYHLCKLAKAIPFPENDVLFVNHNVYDFLIDEEISILVYYADPNCDARDIFKNILSNPKANYNNNISNYKFYSKSIKQFETFSLDIDQFIQIPGYKNSSSGIVKTDEGYLLNVRHVSYKIDKNTGAYKNADSDENCTYVNTLNSHLHLDEQFNYLSHRTFYTPGLNDNHVNGIEDIRIFNTNEGIQFTGNVWQDYGKIKVVTGEYLTRHDNLDFTILDSPFKKDCEKNWSPFIHNDELKFVYDWNPIMIGTLNKNALQITKIDSKQLSNFRGGSPGVVIGNQIWFLTHCVEYSTPRRYYHSFVILDAKTLEYIDHSKLFTFEGENIEFSVGMEYAEDKLIITHSTWDSKAYLKVYNLHNIIKNLF